MYSKLEMQRLDPCARSFKNSQKTTIPVDIYLINVSNGNIKAFCEIFSKLTIKTHERCQ